MTHDREAPAFHAEIEHIGSYVSARYSLATAGSGSATCNSRIFSSRITARAWLEQEAARRGITRYEVDDPGRR